MERGLINILSVFSFWMGACIASFLNVVIWRVPRDESIVSPPSHCPKCNTPLKWYQNLPIIAWLALRGKCAHCKAPIAPRYILIEILGGILFLAAFWRYGYFAPLAWIWISLMIVGSFIDYDLQLLPDFVLQRMRLCEQFGKFAGQSGHLFFEGFAIVLLFLDADIAARSEDVILLCNFIGINHSAEALLIFQRSIAECFVCICDHGDIRIG